MNLSALEIANPQCQLSHRWDYVDRLMLHTLTSLALITVVLICAVIHIMRLSKERMLVSYARSEQEYKEFKKHLHGVVATNVTLFFIILYIVLPAAATTIAGTIGCTDVDPDHKVSSHGVYYMTKDLSISCTSPRFHFRLIYAGVMALI